MSGKEQIIDSILSDAKRIASASVSDAEKEAGEIVSNACVAAGKMRGETRLKAEAEGAEQLKRRLSGTDLEIKKYKLSLKQELMTESFDRALVQLQSLPKPDYLKQIASLLSFAEKDEIVTVSEKDKDIVTAEFLSKVAPDKNLTLNKAYGNFVGGIVLSAERYEKNMTFEALLKELRDEIEPQVNAQLFKG
jgi:vacuolar-type H+-ATPase subunit E/Vma4